MKKNVVLAILDGFGCRKTEEGNAVKIADKPNFDEIWKSFPHTLIEASEGFVGLPDGQMGNSEVGHLNIGAGRIVYQELTRIDKAIEDKEINENPEILNNIRAAKENGKSLHLMGLVSDGGVHSHQRHLEALVELAKKEGLKKVYVHAFLDGRDVPPKSAGEYLASLEKKLESLALPKIATIMGRYYAMDRDQRWERIQLAYDALVRGGGLVSESASDALELSYGKDETDEFVKPTITSDDPDSRISDGDSIMFFNFRADRAREITRAFVDEKREELDRENMRVNFLCLTQYDVEIKAPVAFKPLNMVNTLGEVVSNAGMKQLRIAETEKYAHVTFFFNGGVEKPNENEERIVIPSPKVATYDMKPEMSAFEVCDRLKGEISKGQYDFILVNFANPDMVGHTGDMDAAVKAIEAVDKCIGELRKTVEENGGIMMITADHGNAELMIDPDTKKPVTAHTTNPVPFVILDKNISELNEGSLRDIAPTVLSYLKIEQPEEMTGRSLIKK